MEAFQKIPILRMMARSPSAPPNPSPPTPPLPSRPLPEISSESTPITSERSLRQLSIFLLGSACLLASTAITRKAIWRRNLRVMPKFYEVNTNPHEYFSPFSDACQALNLATMNCVSVGIMALGGTMWTFDIANLKEAQDILRRRLNYESIYGSEDQVPQSIREMLEASREMRVRDEQSDENDKTRQSYGNV